MKYKQTLKVKKKIADRLSIYCENAPGLNNAGREEVLFDEEVTFPNGHRMAIQVIAASDPDEDSCWTQGVLFDADGNELGFTDALDYFLGPYVVSSEALDEYVVEVAV